MDYVTTVDLGAAGNVEIEVDVDEEWMNDQVCDAIIDSYVSDLDADDVMELVLDRMSIKEALARLLKCDEEVFIAAALVVLEE